MQRHTRTLKSLLSVSLAFCGPCPRSQAAVCMAVPSVASHWGGTQPRHSPYERVSFSFSPAVRLRAETGSQLWLTVIIITGSCLFLLISLTCYREQEKVAVWLFPARRGDMTDVADSTWIQNTTEANTYKGGPAMLIMSSAPVRLFSVHKWAHAHTKSDRTHTQRACMSHPTDLDKLYCSVL